MLIALYIIEILFWLLVADVVMLAIVFRKDILKLIKKLWRKIRYEKNEIE